MGRNLNDIISSLPAERRAKIATLSDQKVEEMIAHAKPEQRTDKYASTLRRFMKSLGMSLELSVVDKKEARINLQNFLPDLDADSSTNATKNQGKKILKKRVCPLKG